MKNQQSVNHCVFYKTGDMGRSYFIGYATTNKFRDPLNYHIHFYDIENVTTNEDGVLVIKTNDEYEEYKISKKDYIESFIEGFSLYLELMSKRQIDAHAGTINRYTEIIESLRNCLNKKIKIEKEKHKNEPILIWKYNEAPRELQICQCADVSGGHLALIPPGTEWRDFKFFESGSFGSRNTCGYHGEIAGAEYTGYMIVVGTCDFY